MDDASCTREDDKISIKAQAPTELPQSTLLQHSTPAARASAPHDKRAATPYNLYMKDEVARIKKADPSLPHKEAFKQAAANWGAAKRKPRGEEVEQENEDDEAKDNETGSSGGSVHPSEEQNNSDEDARRPQKEASGRKEGDGHFERSPGGARVWVQPRVSEHGACRESGGVAMQVDGVYEVAAEGGQGIPGDGNGASSFQLSPLGVSKLPFAPRQKQRPNLAAMQVDASNNSPLASLRAGGAAGACVRAEAGGDTRIADMYATVFGVEEETCTDAEEGGADAEEASAELSSAEARGGNITGTGTEPPRVLAPHGLLVDKLMKPLFKINFKADARELVLELAEEFLRNFLALPALGLSLLEKDLVRAVKAVVPAKASVFGERVRKTCCDLLHEADFEMEMAPMLRQVQELCGGKEPVGSDEEGLLRLYSVLAHFCHRLLSHLKHSSINESLSLVTLEWLRAKGTTPLLNLFSLLSPSSGSELTVSPYIYTHVYLVHTYTYIRRRVCVCVCMCVYAYVCMCVCVCVCQRSAAGGRRSAPGAPLGGCAGHDLSLRRGARRGANELACFRVRWLRASPTREACGVAQKQGI
jgi:hypothetical protein